MQSTGRVSQAYDRPSLCPHSTNQSDSRGVYTVTGEEGKLPTQNKASLQHAAHIASMHSSFQTRKPTVGLTLQCFHFMTS